MTYSGYIFPGLDVEVRLSSFSPLRGVAEHRVVLRPSLASDPFSTQLQKVCEAFELLRSHPDLSGTEVIFKRYYLSDIAGQLPLLRERDKDVCAAVQQPPLGGGGLVLLAYLASDTPVPVEEDGLRITLRNGYSHMYAASLTSGAEGTVAQTTEVLERFTASLERQGCSLRDHSVRTWIYVRDIDTHYKDMVEARTVFFERHGLTPDSHFIASTGIEGSFASPQMFVGLDAYAVAGLSPRQVNYLSAPGYLNSPREYGVTFERGTAIDYGDRRQLFISGTASIDPRGNILFPDDVLAQTERTIRNIQALLEAGHASAGDVAYWLVYLRNAQDYTEVNDYFERHFPLVPRSILLAPVCRPGWLVEVESVAIVPQDNPAFGLF